MFARIARRRTRSLVPYSCCVHPCSTPVMLSAERVSALEAGEVVLCDAHLADMLAHHPDIAR